MEFFSERESRRLARDGLILAAGFPHDRR